MSTGGIALAQDEGASADVSASAGGEYRAGEGIRLSDDLLVHPRVEVEGGYQSNVFYTDIDDINGTDASPLLRVGVGASLGNPVSGETASRFQLSGDLQLTWNQFLSGTDEVQERSDLGVQAMLDAKFNPQGAVSFQLRDTFQRQVNPPPAEFADDVDRDKNTLSGILSAKPGGGALEIYGGAAWTVDFFESTTFDFANRNSLEFKVGSRWQWLPKTQFNAEASIGMVFVEDDALRLDTGTATPLRVLVGLSTLLTSNFGLIAKVGYGNSLQSAGPSFNSYLALGEARYSIGPHLKLAGGYSHDFADSIFGNFREDHTIYARLASIVGGRFTFTARGEVRFRKYEGVIPEAPDGAGEFCSGEGGDPCADSDRSDVVYRFTPSISYLLNPWLTIGADYSYYQVETDAFVRLDDTMEDSFAFVWHEVTANVKAQF